MIVDYNTDRIEDGEELIHRYAGQLHLYAEAFSLTFGLPISDCLLYSFHLGKTLSVGISKSCL